MVLSRTRAPVLLVALAVAVMALGIGLWGAVGSASPKDNSNASDKGRTLTVLTKNREVTFVDLGKKASTPAI